VEYDSNRFANRLPEKAGELNSLASELEEFEQEEGALQIRRLKSTFHNNSH
jgi:hypothetical protein